jgi:N-acetylglucosamine-6-sulfatase
MPNVQTMRRDGVTFDHYFVTDSFCCPSRASIFTGEFPHDTGVFTNDGADGGFHAFLAHHDQDRSFPIELRRSGYLTAFYGKFLNLYSLNRTYDGQRPWVAPGWSAWGAGAGAYNEFDYQMAVGHDISTFGHRPVDYLTNVISNKTTRFIAQSAAARKPFMAEISTFAPHAPFTPARRDANRFAGLTLPRSPAYGHAVSHPPDWLRGIPSLTADEGERLNTAFVQRVQSVQAIDRMIGRLRAQLVRLGISDNTYVVFSSDNGMHLGEHDLRQGKQTAFDTDIHVPLVVTGPGVDPGRTITQMTENVDLAPTFESLAGRTPPPNVDGRSLVPLLHGTPPGDWRDAVLVEHHGPLLDPSDPDYQPFMAGIPPSYNAIRTERYLYVSYRDGDREFYDLSTDPFELHNRFASMPLGLRLRLELSVNRLASCHGSTSCWAAGHLRE